MADEHAGNWQKSCGQGAGSEEWLMNMPEAGISKKIA